jgi:hypothetical protein
MIIIKLLHNWHITIPSLNFTSCNKESDAGDFNHDVDDGEDEEESVISIVETFTTLDDS